MSDYEQQKVTIKIPDLYSADDMDRIGQDIVQFIRDRTELGVGVKRAGRGFRVYDLPEYTAAYEKFKGSSKVDLFLSGELLTALDVLDVSDGEITVGYEEGDPINGKAEGNFTGSYGKQRANPKKARSILGITREELDAVLAAYDKVDPNASEGESE